MAGDTYTIKGGSSCVWGVAVTSALGTILDHKVADTAKFEPFENQQGAVTGIIIYDTETVVTLTIVALSSATRPAPGDSITAGTITATVISSTLVASNKGKVKYEITANKWANLTLA